MINAYQNIIRNARSPDTRINSVILHGICALIIPPSFNFIILYILMYIRKLT